MRARRMHADEVDTGVSLVRVTRNPKVAKSAVAIACTSMDGTMTARLPRVSMSRPPKTRTPIAASANAV